MERSLKKEGSLIDDDKDVERRKATVALNKRKQLLDKRKQTENLN